MTIANYERIGNFALAQDNGINFDQDSFPIMISKIEKETIDFNHVEKVMSNNCRKPSEIAGINHDEIVPTIAAVDDVFESAMEKYVHDLETKCRLDENNVTRLDQELRDRIAQQPDWTWEYTVYGLRFLAIGAIPGYLIGQKETEKQKEQNDRDAIEVLREGSAHRRTWLISVDTTEKERMEQTKAIIELRAQAVFGDLEELAENNLSDLLMEDELTQLNQVYKIYVPDNPLTINGEVVNDYLARLERG